MTVVGGGVLMRVMTTTLTQLPPDSTAGDWHGLSDTTVTVG